MESHTHETATEDAVHTAEPPKEEVALDAAPVAKPHNVVATSDRMKSPVPPATEKRTFARKVLNGKSIVFVDSRIKMTGRIYDLSLHGLSVLFDDPIRLGTHCAVECEIHSNGINNHFSVSATAVQNVLVAGKGFRVGFHFQRVSESCSAVIHQVLK